MVIHTLRILLNIFALILYFADKIKVFHLRDASTVQFTADANTGHLHMNNISSKGAYRVM